MKSFVLTAACCITCGLVFAFTQQPTNVSLPPLDNDIQLETADLVLGSDGMLPELTQVSYVRMMPVDDCATCHTQEQLDTLVGTYGDSDGDRVIDILFELIDRDF